MKIALIRHLAPDIAPGICYGRLDIPLLPDQAPNIASLAARPELHGFTRLWSSPAQRCRPLTAAIAGNLGLTAYFDPRLQEIDFGAWEGQAWDSIPRAALDEWAASPLDFHPPGGESGRAFSLRIRAVWSAITATGEDSIIISHGGPLKILRALAQAQQIDLLAPAPPMGEIILLDPAAI